MCAASTGRICLLSTATMPSIIASGNPSPLVPPKDSAWTRFMAVEASRSTKYRLPTAMSAVTPGVPCCNCCFSCASSCSYWAIAFDICVATSRIFKALSLSVLTFPLAIFFIPSRRFPTVLFFSKGSTDALSWTNCPTSFLALSMYSVAFAASAASSFRFCSRSATRASISFWAARSCSVFSRRAAAAFSAFSRARSSSASLAFRTRSSSAFLRSSSARCCLRMVSASRLHSRTSSPRMFAVLEHSSSIFKRSSSIFRTIRRSVSMCFRISSLVGGERRTSFQASPG
mmetsp:Transcript_2597/g.6070  ORF Transcript_2597/g.6070 Transcript_2597/m.6070 type:complete len:287 (+) Transcript_2597:694-1554(+)